MPHAIRSLLSLPLLLPLWACGSPARAAPALDALRVAPPGPVELGGVRWRRGWDAAAAEAKAADKPILVLFDEVPGCATVRGFGEGALSHPLLVEAIESLFVPLFVANNADGGDRAVLERFGEPAWNNPAIRVVDPSGKARAPRFYGDWSTEALADYLVAAAGDAAPAWLALVAAEARAAQAGTETATWRMWCFWQGEAAFGAVDGVVATRTGFADGAEVVELTLDPTTVDPRALRSAAASVGATPSTSGGFRASPADDLHALRGTRWASVPMTPAQASRVNAAVAAGQAPDRFLSPRQRAIGAAGSTQ